MEMLLTAFFAIHFPFQYSHPDAVYTVPALRNNGPDIFLIADGIVCPFFFAAMILFRLRVWLWFPAFI